ESFNMAALWNLPVLYIIENNQYAMGTPVERASAHAEELYHRGSAFGIPGMQVDGMDVRAVKEAADAALAKVRAGGGPVILEIRTHRDPIDLIARRLIEAGTIGDEGLKEIDREIRAIINDAAEFASADPEP